MGIESAEILKLNSLSLHSSMRRGHMALIHIQVCYKSMRNIYTCDGQKVSTMWILMVIFHSKFSHFIKTLPVVFSKVLQAQKRKKTTTTEICTWVLALEADILPFLCFQVTGDLILSRKIRLNNLIKEDPQMVLVHGIRFIIHLD